MALEIERRFLLKSPPVETETCKLITKFDIIQGYLSTRNSAVVRVRISTPKSGDTSKAYLTIKGTSEGMSRKEFEYRIPVPDAKELMAQCEYLITKTRTLYLIGNTFWELDTFSGKNLGLSLVEVELSSKDEKIDIPDWVGEEITGIHKYSNNSLALFPYEDWSVEFKQ